MFEPNSRTVFDGNVQHSHRSSEFYYLLQELKTTFKKKFNLSDDWEVLFITGSASLALEIVIKSAKDGFDVLGKDLEFAHRLYKICCVYNKNDTVNHAMVLYETADSYRNISSLRGGRINLVDAVSAFPYYMIPDDVNVWVTTSSKLLGSLPTISIIVLQKKVMAYIEEVSHTHTYLNLRSYYDYNEQRGQTPHTPAIPLYYDLLNCLETTNYALQRSMIDARREYLLEVIPRGAIIGDGPVLTFEKSVVPRWIIEEAFLYVTKAGNPQVFLYSGTDKQYEEFYQKLKVVKWQ